MYQKTVIAISSISIAIMLAGASCNSQKVENSEPKPTNTPTTAQSVSSTEPATDATSTQIIDEQAELYKSTTYGFALTTTKNCIEKFLVKQDTKDATVFNIMVPLDKQWPKNSRWYFYAVEKKSDYDTKPEEFGGKGLIVAILKNGYVLTVASPQDRPNSIGNCEVTPRNLEAIVKTYSEDTFTVQYPSTYQISKGNQGLVTIFNGKGKIMIGESDFSGPAPTPDMTKEQLDQFPKAIISYGYYGKISSAIFYKTGDEISEKELETIQDSVTLK